MLLVPRLWLFPHTAYQIHNAMKYCRRSRYKRPQNARHSAAGRVDDWSEQPEDSIPAAGYIAARIPAGRMRAIIPSSPRLGSNGDWYRMPALPYGREMTGT